MLPFFAVDALSQPIGVDNFSRTSIPVLSSFCPIFVPWILKGSLRFQRCSNINILDLIPCLFKICCKETSLQTYFCLLWRLASEKPSEQANIEETLSRFTQLYWQWSQYAGIFMCSSANLREGFHELIIHPRWIDGANLIHKPMFSTNLSQDDFALKTKHVSTSHTIHGPGIFIYLHLVDCYGKYV